MGNINVHKRRFDELLESTMGNVKPLISEAPEFEEFVVPTMDMVKLTFNLIQDLFQSSGIQIHAEFLVVP